jgi:leucyl-tRNA synthetase
MAPHLAEEAWALLGHRPSIIEVRWPAFDPALCVEDTVEVAVQVNGKMRGTVTVSRDTAEDEVKVAVLANEKMAAHVAGKDVRRVIFVKNRLINLIVA